MRAAKDGVPDMVKFLIEMGARVDAQVEEAARRSGNVDVQNLVATRLGQGQTVDDLEKVIPSRDGT